MHYRQNAGDVTVSPCARYAHTYIWKSVVHFMRFQPGGACCNADIGHVISLNCL